VKFLCLIYLSQERMDALTPEEQRALDRDSMAYDKQLEAAGVTLGALPLDDPRKGVSLRRVNGRLTQTQGPYAETKEHVGGYILFDVPSIDDALRLAADIPVVRYGGVEIRPVYEMKV
jgi:hypothetical protein